MKCVENQIARYGTIAWDFKKNQEKRFFGFDGPWLFWLIYQENWDFFQEQEGEDEIRDALINNGVPAVAIAPLQFSERHYRLFSIILSEGIRTGQNKIADIWDQYKMELSKAAVLLVKPESFSLPWETDEFWGMEEDEDEPEPDPDEPPF